MLDRVAATRHHWSDGSSGKAGGVQYMVEGPLADPGVLDAVLGAGRYHLALDDGGLAGWLRGTVRPADADAVAVMDYYLAAHGLWPRATETGQAVDIWGVDIAGRRFDADQWPPRWRDIWIEAADEILSYRFERPAAQVLPWLNMIWARADSRLRARAAHRTAHSGFDRNHVRVHERQRSYSKYFTLEDYVLSHPRFDGGHSPLLTRAVFIAADAVTVLPYDPFRDRVLLIEQMRPAPLARGDRGTWLIECVAGRIEPGDTPESTARKETREEAGVELRSLHKVCEYYPSTGAFSEYLYAYVGLADLPDGTAQLAGVPTEGEDIRGHLMQRAELMDAIARGEIPVGPLILSAYWLDANRHLLSTAG
ncbi:MAG: NUDIX domain-containing protein [Rhodobacteraceae bacterium]|nr:NUDIX domain-containing protein [Paracoccaceae bacterium]